MRPARGRPTLPLYRPIRGERTFVDPRYRRSSVARRRSIATCLKPTDELTPSSDGTRRSSYRTLLPRSGETRRGPLGPPPRWTYGFWPIRGAAGGGAGGVYDEGIQTQ